MWVLHWADTRVDWRAASMVGSRVALTGAKRAVVLVVSRVALKVP